MSNNNDNKKQKLTEVNSDQSNEKKKKIVKATQSNIHSSVCHPLIYFEIYFFL